MSEPGGVRARRKSELGGSESQAEVRARRNSQRSVKMLSSKIGTKKFDGSDFGFWKMQIEDYLYQKDIHEPLLGVKPDTMTTEQWKLKDRQALGLIQLTLSET